jgi:hypothetical protein
MLRKRIIKPERRQIERRPSRLAALGDAVSGGPYSDRRIQCWDLEPDCTEEWRRRCPAFFVKRNCWDLWAAEFFPPGRRPCCHPDRECDRCAVAASKFGGDISIYVDLPQRAGSSSKKSANAFCRYLYNSKDGPSSAKVDLEAKGEFKCRRRPGVLLHESYVTDVCSCLEHLDCVFYEGE